MRILILPTLTVVLLAAAAPLTARLLYLDRPPAAHTGGFGESNCSVCHFDNPVNDGVGQVRITGLPERYEPGRSYRVVVELRRPALAAAGFQAAIRYQDGERAGSQAGHLRPLDERTMAQEAAGVTYVNHTVSGASAGNGVARWEIEWTAPRRRSGAAVLHVAANAANADNSEFGDYIYLVEAISRADAGRAADRVRKGLR